MKYLSLWLESPLQSWGVDSKFGLRTTFRFPTKSGIAGILLSSMGKAGEEKEFLESFSSWKESAFSFSLEQGSSNTLNTDYHMIGSGFNSEDEWQKNMIPKKRDGKPPASADKSSSGVTITYRQYLEDTYFGVIFEIFSSFYDVGDIAVSLQNPTWPIYLGRKCCVPSYAIFQGIFDSYEEAKNKIETIAKEKHLILNESMKDGAEPYEGDVICINDVPVKFGTEKEYRDRFVTIIKNEQQTSN